jgi:predicted Rossmann fold flavoprotein
MFDLIVIGAGAAGIFAAIAAKTANPSAKVAILEKSAVALSKVKISGGGRCNVTHACFDPALLIKHYPRGAKELLGPFHRFGPQDTVEWFEKRGVRLKTEADGRMFPVTNSSETIIACLLSELSRLGIDIHFRHRGEPFIKKEGVFQSGSLQSHSLLLATGSGAEGHAMAAHFGHTIQPPVPSLFTFNCPTSPLKELSGVAVLDAEVKIQDTDLIQRGALLITHFGFSGPAVIKLSAWGARILHEKQYKAELSINWLPALSDHEILSQYKTNGFKLPKNLWKALIGEGLKPSQVVQKLQADIYRIEGKTTHKEEFVTCGGVALKEVNFKTMESKVCPGLFFAGEILDIDGVTGGFNFQNAWTTGYIAGNGAA